MQIKIRIPERLLSVWDRYMDWVNEPLWTYGKLEARRIDVGLAIGMIVCVSWYGYTGGWQGALLGGVMYVLMAMIALWIL